MWSLAVNLSARITLYMQSRGLHRHKQIRYLTLAASRIDTVGVSVSTLWGENRECKHVHAWTDEATYTHGAELWRTIYTQW